MDGRWGRPSKALERFRPPPRPITKPSPRPPAATAVPPELPPQVSNGNRERCCSCSLIATLVACFPHARCKVAAPEPQSPAGAPVFAGRDKKVMMRLIGRHHLEPP